MPITAVSGKRRALRKPAVCQAGRRLCSGLPTFTTVLSATTAAKPCDQPDFFPLTVDAKSAVRRVSPGSFRREGRAGTGGNPAACLIDRPLRPGHRRLRNEVQVVETVLTIDPADAYDVLAINAASMSTQIAGSPFTGPIGGTRLRP